MTGTPTLSVRPLRAGEFPSVYRRVARDFPPIEYPPPQKMRRHLLTGAVSCHLCAWGGREAAYAFLLRAPSTQSLLLLLYGVEPEMRGLGVGSAFLRELLQRSRNASGLYAEVEKVSLAADPDERAVRQRRIAFYARLGFVCIPGLSYTIYGVEMHLFYRPLRDPRLPSAADAAAALHALYDNLLSPQERRHLVTRPLRN